MPADTADPHAGAAGIVGDPQLPGPKPAKDGTEGRGAGPGLERGITATSDYARTASGRARSPGSGNLWLRGAAIGLSIACYAMLIFSAATSCCARLIDGTFSAVTEPHGLAHICEYTFLVQLLQILLFCIDRFGGLKVLSNFYGILVIWDMDQSLATSAIYTLWRLPWEGVASGTDSNSKCTSICLPLHAGAAVGALGSALFVIVMALAWRSMKQLRAESPYAS